MTRCLRRFAGVAAFLLPLALLSGAGFAAPKKLVLLAGKKSHGPEGNRIHDYPWSVRLLKVMLDNSNVRDQVRVEIHYDGWPRDPRTLDDADAIMVISDGRDGDKYAEAPHFRTPARTAILQRQIDRGCGFLTFHFSTFAPDARAAEILDWSGGYFDWETDGQRKWYSAIKTLEAKVLPASPGHPVLRGVRPFKMREEFYYNIRFAENDDALRPLWTVPALPGRDAQGKVVAWARQRPNGGRGFGTTCGHFYDNWAHADFRKLILNALLWCAGGDVPKAGVEAPFFRREAIRLALAATDKNGRAVADRKPIRVLIFAGNEEHKWHNWEKTTVAIRRALQKDPRIRVEVSNNIEDLARKPLKNYQVIIQNYANWKDPTPLSKPARKAFVDFLKSGGGLLVPHFGNGAFHYSLPDAGASDWPEYRKIVRRVWDHDGNPRSQHDRFGPFTVEITKTPHVITSGLKDFTVTDELYFNQAGSEPITPLLTARSKISKRDEPLAWTYSYGEGRVFQILLGHSEKTYDVFEVREMYRRAVAWAARRQPLILRKQDDPLPTATGQQSRAAPKQPVAPRLPGKFGFALNPQHARAVVAGNAAFRDPPLTVECWVRLGDPRPYHILVANESKSSGTHWELFAERGSGRLTVYLPGYKPDHVRAPISLCNGKWRYVAMQFEKKRLRLFVDGRRVADQAIEGPGRAAIPGPLVIGGLVSGALGCGGPIDEVRISRGIRPLGPPPKKPLESDADTLALWRFDELAADGQFASLGRLPKAAATLATSVKKNAHPAAIRTSVEK